MMTKHKGIFIFLMGVLLICLALVYFFFDPSVFPMPRCPFFSLTGYLCPGCGSQRAVHSLLHLDFLQAFRFNPLMVVSLPYVALGGVVFLLDKSNKYVLWLRLNLYGRYAVYAWGVIIVLYWIFRNL
jgi:hypothetical protein